MVTGDEELQLLLPKADVFRGMAVAGDNAPSAATNLDDLTVFDAAVRVRQARDGFAEATVLEDRPMLYSFRGRFHAVHHLSLGNVTVARAIAQAGLAQFIFLVLFSYAFFFEGYTGLTVTVGAILTLFVLMQATARVDWGAVFAQRTEREA